MDKSDQDEDGSRKLPAAVWHHILTFLPPFSLSIMLRVNNLFRVYLDPDIAVKLAATPNELPSTLPYLKPNAIWQASRRLYLPHVPAPLQDVSELSMWRLACSTICQFCGLQDREGAEKWTHQWCKGPGTKGVSPVFAFRIVSCAKCLMRESFKEPHLLLCSTIPSILLPGLPVTLISSGSHVVPPHILQDHKFPLQTHVTKLFWPQHVEAIKNELDEVQAFGPAATDEWIKGLEARGKESLADVSRWERWYFSAGVSRVREILKQNVRPGFLPLIESTSYTRSMHACRGSIQIPVDVSDLSKACHQNCYTDDAIGRQKELERTLEAAAQLGAECKRDIERRAALDPSTNPDVLYRMASLQAAIQINAPLNDTEWQQLVPRLLMQRVFAEQRRKDQGEPAHTAEGNQKNAAASIKRNQVPGLNLVPGALRSMIYGYANEIVQSEWAEGKKVSKKNYMQFAADVLLYARERFYNDTIKREAVALILDGKTIAGLQGAPCTQKLTLEDMRWLFNCCIKPLVARFHSNMFICNGCPGKVKAYSLDAVIQHYAAKHTESLSIGSAKVNWKAEWPQEPIFSPLTWQASSLKAPKSSLREQNKLLALSNSTDDLSPAIRATRGSTSRQSSIDRSSHTLTTITSPAALSHAPYPYDNASFIDFQGACRDSPARFSKGHAQTSNTVVLRSSPIHTLRHLRNDSEGSSTAYADRMKLMEKVYGETWGVLSASQGIPSFMSVRIIVHQMCQTFLLQRNEPFTLDMLVDGLKNGEGFHHLGSFRDLHCKLCSISAELLPASFSLLKLANHFNEHHLKTAMRSPASFDWRTDMVYIPPLSKLQRLRGVISIDETGFNLISEVFPGLWEGQSVNQPPVGMHLDEMNSISRANVTIQIPSNAIQSHSEDIPHLLPASSVYGELSTTPHDSRTRMRRQRIIERRGTNTMGSSQFAHYSEFTDITDADSPQLEGLAVPQFVDTGRGTKRRLDSNGQTEYDDNATARDGSKRLKSSTNSIADRYPTVARPRQANQDAHVTYIGHENGLPYHNENQPSDQRRYITAYNQAKYYAPAHQYKRKGGGTELSRPSLREQKHLPPSPYLDGYQPQFSSKSPPVEYEFIEVQDPMGAYYIKRPLPPSHSFSPKYPTSGFPSRPIVNDSRREPTPVYDQMNALQAPHSDYSILVEKVVDSRSKYHTASYEDYDPRYPGVVG